ncbi:Peptide deformylase [hydrothermal vent metagenome]|uniref:Peptide deformylase n=1 Tax=hydrothermal vent metagenome TaxID=652676 RepID=A0A1W1CJH1_9ZZZZ
MIKTITQYPTQTGFDFGGTVRHFDESLQALITDLEDTITANGLEGLSAFQISSPLNVILIKKGEVFLAMMNPVIFTKKGKIQPTESTAYYPNLTAKTTRAKNIKVMYDDEQGKQQFLTAEDELGVLIQRKCDYLMGSTFIIRLSKEEKANFEYKIKTQSNQDIQTCTIEPFSDKILLSIKYALFLGIGALFLIFFTSLRPFLEIFETYLMLSIASLIGIYFVMALYEGKRCGVCQLGNTFAVALMKSIHLSGLYFLNVWLLF